MFSALLFVLGVGFSYLIGSVCSAVIVCQLCHLPDPRTEGSKNPGATNVLRLSGKKYATIVLLADMLKGLLPVIIANSLGAGSGLLGFMCLGAVLGHIYPVFFDFKGGKGVATALGALLGLNIVFGVLICLIWFLVAKISHYSSLAAIVALSLTPILVSFFSVSAGAFFPLLIMTCCVLYQHKDNFIRLQKGEEPKIGT